MMFIETWGSVFSGSLLNLWYAFITFVPGLLGAIILFIIGWTVGSIIGKGLTQIINSLKADRLLENTCSKDFENRTGIKLSISGFLGGLVKWFIIIVFLMASLEIIGLTQVNDFLRQAVLYYLPKVVIAAIVLVIATVLADFMDKIIRNSARAMNVRSSKMLGSISRYAIWIFAIVIALSELGIATYFMQVIFMGLVGALSIALGLAFGLGGKEAASRAVENISKDMSSDK